MEDAVTVIHVKYWQPEEVESYLAAGGANFVGIVDDTTVLKYPKIKGELDDLRKEEAIYKALGPHRHLVSFKGHSEDGIRLERVAYTLKDFLTHATTAQRDRICEQALSALLFFHSRHYLFCDLKIENMLVDEHGNLKFCDLEGQLSSQDGTVAISSIVREDAKSHWPGAGEEEHSIATDLFALGTTIYHILYGHEPFPDLDAYDDEEEIQRRFRQLEFPDLPATALGKVIRKCWSGRYVKVDQALYDATRQRLRCCCAAI